MMESIDGSEFLLSSPGYRIEKARLRYENLLLSLDDDSVDDAERHISETENSSYVHFDKSFNRDDEIFPSSQLESKESQGIIQSNLSHVKSPVKGMIYSHNGAHD